MRYGVAGTIIKAICNTKNCKPGTPIHRPSLQVEALDAISFREELFEPELDEIQEDQVTIDDQQIRKFGRVIHEDVPQGGYWNAILFLQQMQDDMVVVLAVVPRRTRSEGLEASDRVGELVGGHDGMVRVTSRAPMPEGHVGGEHRNHLDALREKCDSSPLSTQAIRVTDGWARWSRTFAHVA